MEHSQKGNKKETNKSWMVHGRPVIPKENFDDHIFIIIVIFFDYKQPKNNTRSVTWLVNPTYYR